RVDLAVAGVDIENGAVGHLSVDRDEGVFLIGVRSVERVAEILHRFRDVEGDDELILDHQHGGRSILGGSGHFLVRTPETQVVYPPWLPKPDVPEWFPKSCMPAHSLPNFA